MTPNTQDSAATYNQKVIDYQQGLHTLWALKMASTALSIITVSVVLLR